MRTLLVALAILVALFVALAAAVWLWQERLLWNPPAPHAGPREGARQLAYVAEDGQPLLAWLVGDPVRAPGLLIAFHGNAEIAEWNIPWATEVAHRTGWAVLLPEYRGYAGLGGTPTYHGSGRDARAAWRLAREVLGADSARIALYGHSLGTAVAAELATEHRPVALALAAPFTSARDMVRATITPVIAAIWPVVGRIAFDTRARVATLDAPVSVAHGDRDAVIPVQMGRDVYAAARRRGALLVVPGAGHNDLVITGGSAYWEWLTRALAVAR